MKRFSTLILLILLAAPAGFALEISGLVTSTTGEPLQDASIVTNADGVGTKTDSDGRYILKSVADITQVTVSCVGYQARRFGVDQIPQTVILEPAVYRGEGVVVTSGRAERGLAPIAFDNFTNDEIERDYTIGDVPSLLETTPNLYSYTWAGGGLGPAEYSIRGFSSKRISVYIDGVPLNDPEDHTTYFVDIPDFAAEVTDIQVQRGPGLSMYGDASLGGSINIASGGLTRPRKITLTTGYGALYEGLRYIGFMRKQSVEYSSGLIDGRWQLAGRYSKQYSDGYRELSWFDGSAYFFSLSRLDPRLRTTINIYGGPIKYHMAFWGITRDSLNDNRRFNPTDYHNETDNYNQPHYELHQSYEISDRATLAHTLYYIRGKGYYEQFKSDRNVSEYNITTDDLADPKIDKIDLVRRKWSNKHQYGFNPRLYLSHDRGQATLGGAFYYFEADHFGQVVWGENLLGHLDPQHRYYQHFGKKHLVSLFAHEYYQLNDRLTAMGSIQLKYLSYDFDQVKMGAFPGHSYNLDWLLLSPRLGFTYSLADETNIFFNFATSAREPSDGMIYDADDPDAKPAIIDGELSADAERVYSFELGADIRRQSATGHLNLFWMEFVNEIISSGGVDGDGHPVLGNAGRSRHAGVELSGSYTPCRQLTISGNGALTCNRIKEYVIYNDNDWDGISDDTTDYSGNRVAGFPCYLANLIFDTRYDPLHRLINLKAPLRYVFRLRAVGRQYVENGGNKELSIDPYVVTSMSASVSLGRMADYGAFTLSARYDNPFGTKYEASGVADEWGAYYIPGPERSIFVQLKCEFE